MSTDKVNPVSRGTVQVENESDFKNTLAALIGKGRPPTKKLQTKEALKDKINMNTIFENDEEESKGVKKHVDAMEIAKDKPSVKQQGKKKNTKLAMSKLNFDEEDD